MEAIAGTFANFRKKSGFPPLAEQAVAEPPDEAGVLFYAMTAALLDERNDRAIHILKLPSRLPIDRQAEHPLRALSLSRQKQLTAARELLELHDLTATYDAPPCLRLCPRRLAEAAARWREPKRQHAAHPRNGGGPVSFMERRAPPRLRPRRDCNSGHGGGRFRDGTSIHGSSGAGGCATPAE
jgi:hypothetical protein